MPRLPRLQQRRVPSEMSFLRYLWLNKLFLLLVLFVFGFVFVAVLVMDTTGLTLQFSSLTCEDSGGVKLSGDNKPDCLINGSGSSLFAISCFGFTLRCRLSVNFIML